MAEGIVYLDVDDEITSAASRIRSTAGTKVALVVPFGSRIATSRMNFRLLSREAVVSNRRLSIVSGDAAARSLAASAGLPVFATVPEYESALAGPKPVEADDAPVAPIPEADRPAPAAKGRTRRKAAAAEPPTEPLAPVPVADIVPAETVAMAAPQAGPRPMPVGPDPEPGGVGLPVVAARRPAVRTPVLVGIAVLALAAVIVGVAGYLLLPSATIAVTPRQEAIGPIDLTISADPTATAVDATNGIVPAIQLEVPVEASRTFTTTGKHVEQAAASGSVTFSNYDPTASNTIAAGSFVSTEGGIRFRTQAAVTLPRADFVVGLPIMPSTRSVAVEAVKLGPNGNVPANAIRVVPQGENPEFLKVNNPDPTAGGVRSETPQVSRADVDKAVAALNVAIRKSFDDAIAGGAGAPAGATLFPDTAALGEPTPDVDPASLVGKAVPTFDLAMTASGTVIAVDPSPIRSIAEGQLRNRVGADHRLVDGSTRIDVGAGSVGEDGQVTFQATALATRVTIVEASQLRALVKGKTVAEAEAALAPLGAAQVVLWPAWVTTVTGVDARLSISITGQDGSSGGGASAPPSAGAGADTTARPSRPAATGAAPPSASAGSAAP